jgi:hypothetical protein
MERHACVTAAYMIPGQTWPRELCWLYDNMKDSSRHVEIGVYCGRSLFASCGGMTEGSVLSVDNDSMIECDSKNEWVSKVRNATFSMVETAAIEHFGGGSLDAAILCRSAGWELDSVFIDGCHQYAECLADIGAWMPLLKSGGLIAGHDYWPAHIGVMDAVNEYFGDKFSVAPDTRIWFHRKG